MRLIGILVFFFAVEAKAQDASPGPSAPNPTVVRFDAKAAERFAKLALACVHKEYPNKISHVLTSDADVAPPRKLTPAFCGCYDWHSSVHGHWLLVGWSARFRKLLCFAQRGKRCSKSLTAGNLKQEAGYLRATGRATSNGRMGCRGYCSSASELGNGRIQAEKTVVESRATGTSRTGAANDCGCRNCRTR